MSNGLELQRGDASLSCAGTVPVVIDYRAFEKCIVSWDHGGDIVFSEKFDNTPVKVGVPITIPDSIVLDPYKVRDAFEAARSEQQVRQFLNQAGEFWPFGSIRLSQFEEWQAFVKLIRREDFAQLAMTDKQAYQASLALNNFPNTCLTFDHPNDEAEIERAVEQMPEQLRPNMTAAFKDSRKWRTERIRALLTYFASPTAFVEMLYTPEAIKQFQCGERESCWPPATEDTMPAIVFKPMNVLEAIAATLSADRLKGIKHRACGYKDCGNLVPRLQNSGKRKYCERSDCKGKARSQRRTEDDHKARAFYIEQRRAGNDFEASKSMATEAGHVLTSRIIERAEKALSKKSPSASR